MPRRRGSLAGKDGGPPPLGPAPDAIDLTSDDDTLSADARPPALFETFLPSGPAEQAVFYASSRRAPFCTCTSPLAALTRLFLPRGELPPDYLAFQALDSLQALCSYLRGVLTLNATLTGLGVGRGAESSALAATLALLLKDASSHVTSLTFSFFAAMRLDSEVRAWRLFADVANDVGLTLELLAPLVPSHFLALSCAANAAKAVCGVAAGATKVAVSAHFARAAALSSAAGGAAVAEVAAKEATQETAMTLTGLALGYVLAQALNASLAAQWVSFILLTVVHVAANYAAVRVLALATLSRTRATLLADTWSRQHGRAVLPSPLAARTAEPTWPVQWWRGWGERVDGGRVRLGVSVDVLAAVAGRLAGGGGAHGNDSAWTSRVAMLFPDGSVATLLSAPAAAASSGDYALFSHSRSECAVAFGPRATVRTMLRGWTAAARGWLRDDASNFIDSLELAGWDTCNSALEEEGYRVDVRR